MAENILSNFERFDRDGLELVVDTATGLAYASISAAARMIGIDRSNLRRTLNKGGSDYDVTNAAIPTSGGIQGGSLLPASVVLKLAIKYNPGLAEKMGTAGANVYMLKLAGYSIEIKEQPAPTPAPALPQNYLEALKALVASEEAKAVAEAKLLAAQVEIEQQAPLVEYATAVQHSEDSIEFNEFAKMIGTGRTRLFRAMREAGVIMKNSSLPYQQWCDAGYFEISQQVIQNGIEDKLIPFALVTGKGQIWLRDRLVKSAQNQARIAGAIARDVMQMSIL